MRNVLIVIGLLAAAGTVLESRNPTFEIIGYLEGCESKGSDGCYRLNDDQVYIQLSPRKLAELIPELDTFRGQYVVVTVQVK